MKEKIIKIFHFCVTCLLRQSLTHSIHSAQLQKSINYLFMHFLMDIHVFHLFLIIIISYHIISRGISQNWSWLSSFLWWNIQSNFAFIFVDFLSDHFLWCIALHCYEHKHSVVWIKKLNILQWAWSLFHFQLCSKNLINKKYLNKLYFSSKCPQVKCQVNEKNKNNGIILMKKDDLLSVYS